MDNSELNKRHQIIIWNNNQSANYILQFKNNIKDLTYYYYEKSNKKIKEMQNPNIFIEKKKCRTNILYLRH